MLKVSKILYKFKIATNLLVDIFTEILFFNKNIYAYFNNLDLIRNNEIKIKIMSCFNK